MQPACCRAPAPPGLLRPHCAQKRPIPRGPLQNWLLKGQTGKRLCQLKPLRRCNASLNGPRPPTWAPAPSGRGERPLGGPPLLWGGPQGGAIWGSLGLGVRGGGVGRPALGDGVICRAWGSRKHLQPAALGNGGCASKWLRAFQPDRRRACAMKQRGLQCCEEVLGLHGDGLLNSNWKGRFMKQ